MITICLVKTFENHVDPHGTYSELWKFKTTFSFSILPLQPIENSAQSLLTQPLHILAERQDRKPSSTCGDSSMQDCGTVRTAEIGRQNINKNGHFKSAQLERCIVKILMSNVQEPPLKIYAYIMLLKLNDQGLLKLYKVY